MNNNELSSQFIEAIKTLVSNPNAIESLQFYLDRHFTTWYERYANTPEGLISEIETFASMEE